MCVCVCGLWVAAERYIVLKYINILLDTILFIYLCLSLWVSPQPMNQWQKPFISNRPCRQWFSTRKKGSVCLLSVDMNSLWCSHQLCWFCSRTQLTRDLRGRDVWILSTPEELWVTTKTHDTALCWSVYQCDLTVIQCNLRVISVWSQLSPICYTRKSFEKNRFRGMLSFTVFIFAGKCGLQQN